MRRLLSVLLVLVITLGCLPCQAVEASWSGPLSQDASPALCDTGRGYIVYYLYASAVYYSEDGVTWTDLSDRQWVQDARAYIPLTSPMVHREFQFIWTGTEYMMRQDLRDDPRLTHQKYGDSPRNDSVTFLDEDFQIIGQRAFNGPVSDIRYEDGTYYATVDGSEVAFTREDWEAGAGEAVTFSDVPADAWYAQGVALCAEKGIMVGTGDGAFSPDEILSFNQCMTLALRLYDLLHGGDGVLAPPPEDWVKPTLTLTLADGTELTGHGNETVALRGVEGGRFRFGWWAWGMMGMFTRENLHVTLEPDLEKNFDNPEYRAAMEMLGQWGNALEGPATVTVGDRVISGTVSCWIPTGDWGLSFYPDGEDTAEVTQFLHSATYSDAPADNAWWRDGAWYRSQTEELREKSNLLIFRDEDCDASRWDFALTLYTAIGELPTLRTVEVPDLEQGYRSAVVHHLYEAGILTGVDPYGTFDGEGSFTRAQAAVMVARVLDESLRVSTPLAPLPE